MDTTSYNAKFSLLVKQTHTKSTRETVTEALSWADVTAYGTTKPSEVKAKKFFPFLSYPREIRDLIYDACIEDQEWGVTKFAPRIKHSPGNSKSWKYRPWQFYALTQTNSQVRTEYHPKWLHQLRVQTSLENFSFFDTILPPTFRTKITPQLIQLVLPLGEDKKEWRENVTPLVKFKAQNPKLIIQVFPKFLCDIPYELGRDFCLECLHASDPADSRVHKSKPHGFQCTANLTRGSVRDWHLSARYLHTTMYLNQFFANTNAQFLGEVREGKTTWLLKFIYRGLASHVW